MLHQLAASPWRQMSRNSVLAIAMTVCAGFATAEYLQISVAPAHPVGPNDRVALGESGPIAPLAGGGKLQAIIDASPRMDVHEAQAAAEMKVVPLPRPKFAQDRSVHTANRSDADVARFETCLPQCESQDRLLVQAANDPAVPPAALMIQADDVEIGPAPTPGLPRLLSRVIAGPATALRHGRDLVARLDW